MSVRVSPATAAEVPALAELHRAAFAEPWSAAALAQLLVMPGAFAWLATRAGRPAGFVLARAAAEEAEILTLAVVPEARRCGIGRALVGAVAGDARARGAGRLHLEVAEDNEAGLALYRACGFSIAGRRRNYYVKKSGNRGAACLMTLDFAEAGR